MSVSIAYMPIPVAAFNVQTLGPTKIGKTHVVDVIRQIMLRHAICLVQEIRDASGVAPKTLLDTLNDDGADGDFALKLSARFGRGSYKEQYGIYYRKSVCTHEKDYQYEDPNYDTFERPPYGAVFNCPAFGADCFGVLVIHVKPDHAVIENDALRDVYDDFKSNTSCPNVLVMGDLNADCAYVTSNEWSSIRLWTDTDFDWLVADSVDTTVKTTDCAYDRIVVNTENAYYNQLFNAGPFKFEEEIPLGSVENAHEVSDHYPVEVDIKASSSGITVSDDICIQYSIDLSSKQDVLNEIDGATLGDWSLTKTEDGELVEISGGPMSDMPGMLDDLTRHMRAIFPWFEMKYVLRASQTHGSWAGCKFFDGTVTAACASATHEDVLIKISGGSVRFCVQFSA